eukprot:GFKZ01000127.1.p1 GENE.GFKZ01000127.1~~GFKZ01000127.1.p1  ORF type:complete len:225 (-),score=24.11 GFKZ01000127.1:174-848(-)
MSPLALLLLLSTLSHSHPLNPNTPVQTVDGQIVPLSNCLFKSELSATMHNIGRQMTTFGISPPVANDYQTYVNHIAAKPAVANSTVVCIPPASMVHVGRRLGVLILDHLNAEGPTKRRGNGARGRNPGARGGAGFRFDGDRDDSFDGEGKKCCRCETEREYVFDAGKACPAGPCCPQLCEALWAIGTGASAGPDECCLESELKCLHERKGDNSGGARGNRGRFT